MTAQLVDLSDIVPQKACRTPDQAFYQNLAVAISQVVAACKDAVPVVTGMLATYSSMGERVTEREMYDRLLWHSPRRSAR